MVKSKKPAYAHYNVPFSPWAVELPYPPSVNHSYMTLSNGRRILKPEARDYRHLVSIIVANGVQRFGGVPCPFSMWVTVYPPDRRKRDLDNLLKVLQDAITDGLRIDDSHIQSVAICRSEPFPSGRVEVSFTDVNLEWFVQHSESASHRMVRYSNDLAGLPNP